MILTKSFLIFSPCPNSFTFRSLGADILSGLIKIVSLELKIFLTSSDAIQSANSNLNLKFDKTKSSF